MAEKIGLEAILNMGNFNRGMKDYTTGVGELGDVTDRGASRLSRIGSALGTVGKVGLGVAAAGVTAVGGALVGFVGSATKAALETEAIRKNFDVLAESIGTTSEVMIQDLREATRGMVKDSELMAASNKFVSMGLADSAEEAAQMAEMATQLGMAMGVDATQSMEDFALMLANQSIPRLDTFGISSGKVRQRIEELMEADEDLTREQAFMTAVMEQGTESMDRLGEQGDTTQANMARIQATMSNLKETIGAAFLPVFGELLGRFSEFVSAHAPQIQAAFETMADWLMTQLPIAIQTVSDFWTNELQPALQAVWSFIETSILPLFQTVASWFRGEGAQSTSSFAGQLQSTLGPALEFAQQMFAKVVGWVQDNWPLIQETVQTVLTAITAFWEEHGARIMAIVNNAFTAAKTVITTILDAILGIVRAVMLAINGDWAGAWEAIKGVVETVWNGIVTLITLAFDNVKNVFEIAKTELLRFWGKLWAGIKAWAEDAWADLVRGVVGWVADFVGKFVDLRSRILSIGTSIVDGIKAGIENAWDSFVQWVLDQIGSILDDIKEFLGIGSPAKAMMPIGAAMAQGVAAGWESAMRNISLGGTLGSYNVPAMGAGAGGGASTTNNSFGGDTIVLNIQSREAWGMAQQWVESRRRVRLNRGM